MLYSTSARRLARHAVIAWIAGALITIPGVAGTIGATAATPNSAPVGQATTVTVTSLITDPSLIPTSVQLQRLDSTGRAVAIVGNLHDDGLGGDAAAGDHIFTLQTTVYQTAPGSLTYRVAAGFKGSLLLSYSAPITVAVTGPSIGITIQSPANLLYTNISPVNVSGTVGDPAAQVKVNGINAPVTSGKFLASVPLVEGLNTLTAVATNTGGSITTASVQVTLDTTPPHVTIDSPTANYITTAASSTVTGTVNDIVLGTVNSQQASVTVNGVAAQVTNRSFTAANVPLAVGTNTIQAVARDQAGNSATTSVQVQRTAQTQPFIKTFSGDNQSGRIGTQLAAPLVVAVTDGSGRPVANQPVIFQVTQNNGLIANGGAGAVTLTGNTDVNGQAKVTWTLGTRAGAGNNQVQATALGYAGTALFTASGVPSNAAQIVVDSGNEQTGALGQPLTFPFVAVVIDSGNNRVSNVPVTFTVKAGGGNIGSSVSSTVNTDSDGRAQALLTLGTDPGQDNNVVTASFAGNPGQPATFFASAKAPGNPAATQITGVVLNNSNIPIQGVTMRLFQTNQGSNNNVPAPIGTPVQTNAQGQFTILQAPVGFFKLMADGTTVPGASYPTLEYDITTVAGQNNTIGSPIYLPILDTVHKLCVTPTAGGTLTLPQVPGFSLTVGANTATFPGGSRSGCISVTQVNGDKVPMTPGFGQQPRFIVTIQPVGTIFNPPAPMTLPNVEGLKPRQVTEMYSYDHDLSAFVAIGTGTVSADGSIVQSDPGAGVLKAGWHCAGPTNPTGTAQPVGVSITSDPMPLISAGNSTMITASGTPVPGNYSWSSSDPTVATVTFIDGTATVLGIAAGTVVITVTYTCESGEMANASVVINVVGATSCQAPTVSLTKVTPASAKGSPSSTANSTCAVPVNFVILGIPGDIGNGNLQLDAVWDSSTGSGPEFLSDLSTCVVNEYVIYPGGGTTYTYPNPPFNETEPVNPFVGTPVNGSDGILADTHFTPTFSSTLIPSTPPAALQYYYYQCANVNDGKPVILAGPISITRSVTKNTDGTFKYTVTKLGFSATLDPIR